MLVFSDFENITRELLAASKRKLWRWERIRDWDWKLTGSGTAKWGSGEKERRKNVEKKERKQKKQGKKCKKEKRKKKVCRKRYEKNKVKTEEKEKKYLWKGKG